MTTIDILMASAFTLIVTGAAMSPWPWLALFAAAFMFLALVMVIDRRTPPPEGPPP